MPDIHASIVWPEADVVLIDGSRESGYHITVMTYPSGVKTSQEVEIVTFPGSKLIVSDHIRGELNEGR